MKAKRVGPEAEKLGKFVNGLREYLGLDPLHRPRSEARETKVRELDVMRFGATRPDPWHPARTPMRGSGNG
jgi:hypothetical protein